MNNLYRRGQSLPEALVAISVLMMGFLGMFALLSQSLSLNRVVTENYTGSYLATEGVEVVKNIIDSNRIAGRAWDAGLSDGTYEVEYGSSNLLANANRTLSFDPVMKTYSYTGSRSTNFRRTVQIIHVTANHLQVNARVNWVTRGGGAFDIDTEDHYYRWR